MGYKNVFDDIDVGVARFWSPRIRTQELVATGHYRTSLDGDGDAGYENVLIDFDTDVPQAR